MKVRCPRCSTTLEVQEGDDPTCPECGFHDGPVEVPEAGRETAGPAGAEPEGGSGTTEPRPEPEPAASEPGPADGGDEARSGPSLTEGSGRVSRGSGRLQEGSGRLTGEAAGDGGEAPSTGIQGGGAGGTRSGTEARQVGPREPAVDVEDMDPLEGYTETVEHRLRGRGFERRGDGPPRYEAVVFHDRSFQLSKFGLVDTFVVVAPFEDPDPGTLKAFCEACHSYGLSNKSSLPRGLGGSLIVHPVAVVPGRSRRVSDWIRRYDSKKWGSFLFPAVVDLADGAVDYHRETPLWGALYYSGFRSFVDETLTPPAGVRTERQVEEAGEPAQGSGAEGQARSGQPAAGAGAGGAAPGAGTAAGAGAGPGSAAQAGAPAQGTQAAAGAYQEWTEPAGFWKRFGAFLVDALLLGMAQVLATFVGPAALIAGGMGPSAAGITVNVFGIVLAWLYFAGFESSGWQATPGKKALSLKVTGGSGSPVSFGRATGRHFGKLLSALLLGAGFIMIGFTSEKQGLHDMVADCHVVESRGARAPPPAPQQ